MFRIYKSISIFFQTEEILIKKAFQSNLLNDFYLLLFWYDRSCESSVINTKALRMHQIFEVLIKLLMFLC